ncbi:hypothetical protein C1N76_10895 [Geobacillus thermoleovorans]|uniref:Uncharacterized protein n=1 Tax=Geobacillus thermoleovorans TaxID=33941 RepID=A0A2Z3N7V0_GEOTH|nr:hypothetical protein C1N76_10895 [Geobacillus thermoleovorans]
MKPEKYSFKEFYIEPIVDLGKRFFKQLLEHLGWWECEKCGKLYSPRVKKYRHRVSLMRLDIVCSICYRELEGEHEVRG